MPIGSLLDILDRMYHISYEFRNEITPFLTVVSVKKGDRLLEIGYKVGLAWFLITGFVAGRDKLGNVTRLYKQKRIITDLPGFFEGKAAAIDLIAVTDCELLVLTREKYLLLEAKYTETVKLKDHCFFLENGTDIDRAEMLRKKPQERFNHFSEQYKFALVHLPNRLCASFTNIHETDFSKFKARYFKAL